MSALLRLLLLELLLLLLLLLLLVLVRNLLRLRERISLVSLMLIETFSLAGRRPWRRRTCKLNV
jgi:hypothetical protein